MLADQSHLFAVPRDITYLNSAYIGPRLHSVTDAGARALEATGQPWKVVPADFFEPVDALRANVAAALNADAAGVAIIAGISYGAGTAALNLSVGHGRTVVMLGEQFPSNVYPWQAKVASEGGAIVTVPRTADGWTSGVLEAIDSRTAVVSVPNCHWTDGSLVDLVAVGEAARAVGAALCVDASQSFCAMPLDVGAVRPDFLYSTAYKWQLGFYGHAYLWVAEQHRSGIPLEQGWASRKGATDFAGLVDYTDVYEEGAKRFDAGERSNFVGVAMSNAAMDQITTWGVDAVAATLRSKTDRIASEAQEIGWVAAKPEARAPHLIGIRKPGGLPPGIKEAFAAADVSVSVRGDSIRIGPHLHTTDAHIDRLVSVLRSVA
jgi:selenocysteine lyase/cysteine desulfurase